MPKRRVPSVKQRAASARNLVKARAARKVGLPPGYTPPGQGGRRSKMGGKAYHHKTASNFKVAQEAKDLLSGKTTFAQTEAKHASSGMGHNGRGLVDSPRGGGHKMAPPIPASAKRAKPRIEQHGSGTGLTSAYRYLPINVAKRRALKGKKVK